MPDKNSKTPWKFDPNLTDPNLRSARALEHIAYYLDRIELHLGKIAGSLADDL